VKAMKDPIPNVRFCVSKIIIKTKSCFDHGALVSLVQPGLKEMSQDADKDVQYFAVVAINEI